MPDTPDQPTTDELIAARDLLDFALDQERERWKRSGENEGFSLRDLERAAKVSAWLETLIP